MSTANPEKLEERATRLVEDWPPLTPAQRDRIAVLLRGGGGRDG